MLIIPDLNIRIPDGDDYIDYVARYVDHIRKQLNISELIIVGHSLGGYVALYYARNYFSTIKALFLLNVILSADQPQKSALRLREIELLRNGAQKSIVQFGLRRSYSANFIRNNTALFKENLSLAISLNVEVQISQITSMIHRKNYMNWLLSSSLPFIVLHGFDDQILNSLQVRKERKVFGDKVQIIKGEGHVMPVENPLLVGREIVNFITDVDV